MNKETRQVDLLDAAPAIGAARVAILACRSRLSFEAPLVQRQLVLLPDLQPVSIERGAERLASIPPPVRCLEPETRDEILVLKCETITNSRTRLAHERMCEVRRHDLFSKQLGGAAGSLAGVKVLVDGRDERLMVTGAAFDRWLAGYDPGCSYAGGPADDDWVLAQGLGEAVRASRPDYVFRFSGPVTGDRIVLRMTRDARDGERGPCARCGGPASKVEVEGGSRIIRMLCAECAEQITDEVMADAIAQASPEELAAMRQSVGSWLMATTGPFPDDLAPLAKDAEQRAWIKRFRKLLDVD